MGLFSELIDTIARSEIDWERDFAYPVESHGGHGITVRGVNNNDRTTTFIASTDTPDRAMDVVRQDWRLANFRSNPVILDGHNPMRVVGRAVDVSVPRVGDDAGKLVLRVEWDDDSPDPSIRAIGHQHRKGIRRAGSVGFRARKKTRRDKLPKDHPHYQEPIEIETWWGKEKVAGWLFESPELLEFSSVSVPMNAEALQRSIGLGPGGERHHPDSSGDPSRPLFGRDDFLRSLQDPQQAAAAIDALWPGILEKARHDPQLRRIVRAMADAGPPRGSSGPSGGFFASALAKIEGDES